MIKIFRSIFSSGRLGSYKQMFLSFAKMQDSLENAFSAAFCSSFAFFPFNAIKIPPVFKNGIHHSSKIRSSATALAQTTSNVSRYAGSAPSSSARPVKTWRLESSKFLAAWAIYAVFFAVESSAVTEISGRTSAKGSAGMPEPLPTSRRRHGPSGK